MQTAVREGDHHWAPLPVSPVYARVEQRVIRQLIQGIIFEGVLSAAETAVPRRSDVLGLSLYGCDASGRTVRYVTLGARKASFGRLRLLATPVQRWSAHSHCSDATLMEFLNEVMTAHVPAERMPALVEELQQTLLKDTQSQMFAGMPDVPDLAWDHDRWEGHLQEGHPYHPSYKSRLGFALDDNARYGPEFQQDIRPIWLAVENDVALVSSSVVLGLGHFLRAELGEPTWQRFQAVLVEQGRRVDEYTMLPVHPWQWLHRIMANFHPELAAGRIVYLGTGDDEFRAQQSIRTLFNASHPEKTCLKLALGITNTSTSRGLAAHTVQNSATISDWLHDLVARDNHAHRFRMVILREFRGVAFDHSQISDSRGQATYASLGALWRESLHPYLSQNERAIAFNGLTQSTALGVPLIDGWIEQYGVKTWTRQLLDVTVTPIIHMLYAHGIGLEAHGQNILLIHRNGWPARIALKDFHDGVRFSIALLSEPDNAPNLVPEPASHAAVNRNSYIQTQSADEVRDYTYDAFVFIALAELCLCLDSHYGVSEADFWAMTADTICRYQFAHPHLADRFDLFDLFADQVNIEDLTKRRLFGDDELHFTKRNNPLHPFRPSRAVSAC